MLFIRSGEITKPAQLLAGRRTAREVFARNPTPDCPLLNDMASGAPRPYLDLYGLGVVFISHGVRIRTVVFGRQMARFGVQIYNDKMIKETEEIMITDMSVYNLERTLVSLDPD